MATILLTGKISLFSPDALERLAQENTVVVAGEGAAYKGDNVNIRAYDTKSTEDKFGQLFDAHTFDAVWYVSGYVNGGEGTFGEMQMLERALNECARAQIGKMILLSTIDSQNYLEHYGRSGEMIRKQYPNGRCFGAAQIEETAAYYASSTKQRVITLWLPYIVGEQNYGDFLNGVFRRIRENEKVMFPYHRDDRIDFLSMNDLLDLCLQITEETDDVTGSYYAISGYRRTYGELEEMLKLVEPQTQVLYENFPQTTRWPDYPMGLRRRYGFVPMDDVLQNVGSYYRAFSEGKHGRIRSFFIRLAKRIGSGFFKYFELVVVFLLAELISRYTSNSVYFRFVDVRLFFIVIMGTIHGMKIGVLAALMESVVLVFKFMEMGTSGVMLFYNIENWIPFVIYIMAGIISGYVKDKNTNELTFANKEYALLRDKYVFLSNVYQGAIRSKGEFKRQILGFKDSFGKIFDAVQKLDSELPQSVFLEGLRVVEEIMENRTAAIYSLDEYQRFGRLVVCSSSLISKLTKSIRVEEYREVMDTVQTGAVWRNTDLKQDLPMYACGVFRDGMLVLLITLWEADAEQYSMSYTNIFRILCGLVQTSLLRAMEYEALREEQTTLPGTNVVRPEHFRQILDVQRDMKDAGVADYVLLRFEQRDARRVSEDLGGMIRASDTLGQGEDGCIYLLLTQMTRDNFMIVGRRLDARGIAYRQVEQVG